MSLIRNDLGRVTSVGRIVCNPCGAGFSSTNVTHELIGLVLDRVELLILRWFLLICNIVTVVFG